MITQNADLVKKANLLASQWTDPSIKYGSFYCIMKRKVKAFTKSSGVEFELRKATLMPWVVEYLIGIFEQNLSSKEEKALIAFEIVANHILETKLPEYAQLIQHKKSCSAEVCACYPPFITLNGKVLKRGGKY